MPSWFVCRHGFRRASHRMAHMYMRLCFWVVEKFGREGVLQCVLVMDVHVDVTARKDGVAQDATGCSVDHHTLEPFPVPPGILTKAGIFAHTSDPVGRISP